MLDSVNAGPATGFLCLTRSYKPVGVSIIDLPFVRGVLTQRHHREKKRRRLIDIQFRRLRPQDRKLPADHPGPELHVARPSVVLYPP